MELGYRYYNAAGQMVYKERLTGERGYLTTGSAADDKMRYLLDAQGKLGELDQFNNLTWTVQSPKSSDATGRRYVTTSAGDTLSSLAASQFGDASLWYLIASENGLSTQGPNEALSAGQRLRLPVMAPNHNTAKTFTPFNQAAAMGDTAISTPIMVQKGLNPNIKKIFATIAAVVAFAAGLNRTK